MGGSLRQTQLFVITGSSLQIVDFFSILRNIFFYNCFFILFYFMGTLWEVY